MANLIGQEAYWRDSARVPRFYFIDGKATFPIVLFLIHIRWWTFITVIIAILFFSILERYGFRLKVFLIWARSTIAGKRKMSHPWWR